MDFRHIVDTMLAEAAETLHAVDPAELAALRRALVDAPRIFAAGKGRSGLHMRAFAMRLVHLGLAAHVVDEVTTPAIAAGDLLLVGSGSGRTASPVRYAQTAKGVGARVALITAAESSPLGDATDVTVHLAAPTPKIAGSDLSASIQPMGSRFEMSLGVLLDALVLLLMDDLGATADAMFARHANLE